MKIGIFGSGDVGLSIGHGMTELGHEVRIGARNPKQEKTKHGVVGQKQISVGSFADAAAFGELVVFATDWKEMEEAIKLAGPENFTGKVVLDVTNPLDSAGGGRPKPSAASPDSGGEKLQCRLPGARVVGAFSAIGGSHLFHPNFEEGQPEMFICGNDQAAKKEATEILAGFGWPVVDLGPIEACRYLEPLAMGFLNHGLHRRCSRRFCAQSRCTFAPFCLEPEKSEAQRVGV